MDTTLNHKKSGSVRVFIIIIALLAIAAAVWAFMPRGASFCFDFLRNMHYGENKTLENPVNSGIQGNGGIMYFPVETKALHTALKSEGFYIDPVEETGGGVYLTTFFGPSTNVAVRGFQQKYGLEQTGIVDDLTADKLTSLYGCPAAPVTATSTTATSTSSEE